MIRFELKKIFVKKSVWILAGACLVLQIIFSVRINVMLPEGFRDDIYRYYTQQIEGRFSAEKRDFMVSEYERMKELITRDDEYREQFYDHEISADEYKELSDQIKSAETRIVTVEYLCAKGDYYSTLEEPVEYFYDIAVTDYVESWSPNFFVILSIIMIISVLALEDENCNTVFMVRSSRNGRVRLFRLRMILAGVLSLGVSLLFYLAEFLTKLVYFDMGNLSAPMNSLMVFASGAGQMTIGAYIAQMISISVAASGVLGILTLLVGMLTKKNIATYIIMLGVAYLPYLCTQFIM